MRGPMGHGNVYGRGGIERRPGAPANRELDHPGLIGREEGSHWDDQGHYHTFTRGPRGYVRSDRLILEELCERLANDGDLDVSDITVDVRDGTVQLGGTVESRRNKHHIEDAAASILGVVDVENRIRVRRYGEQSRRQASQQADEGDVGAEASPEQNPQA